jgi:hypothetical protein
MIFDFSWKSQRFEEILDAESECSSLPASVADRCGLFRAVRGGNQHRVGSQQGL